MLELNLKGINLDNLSEEQRNEIQKKLTEQFGHSVVLVAAKSQPKSMGALEGKLNDGKFVCPHCGTVETFDALSEDDKTYAKKFSTCAACSQKVRDAEKIALISPKRTVIREGESAFTIAKSAVLSVADKISPSAMEVLQDQDWCKRTLKIRLPLFIEVNPESTPQQLKEAACDTKGKRRYSGTPFKFAQLGDRMFLMCNDIYQARVNALVEGVKSLIITDEYVHDIPTREKYEAGKALK